MKPALQEILQELLKVKKEMLKTRNRKLQNEKTQQKDKHLVNGKSI